jgi:hypothetical protein
MTTDTLDSGRIAKLSRCAANFNWSFVLFAVMYVIAMATPTSRTTPPAPRSTLANIISLVTLGSYVWYAFAAGSAARMLGSSAWKYVVWILLSPVLSIVLTVVLVLTLGGVGLFLASIIRTVVNASPLAIRFLLGGQLAAEIRDASTVSLSRP